MMSTECAERAARGAAAGNGVLSRVHKNAIARVFFKIYPPLGGWFWTSRLILTKALTTPRLKIW